MIKDSIINQEQMKKIKKIKKDLGYKSTSPVIDRLLEQWEESQKHILIMEKAK